MDIPQKYKDLVGTKQTASGHLFSHSKELEPKEYDVLDIRFGTGKVMNMDELMKTGESSYEYATFQLLLKNDEMKKAQWTKSFPMPEIDYKKLNQGEIHERSVATDAL